MQWSEMLKEKEGEIKVWGEEEINFKKERSQYLRVGKEDLTKGTSILMLDFQPQYL